jgi:hypothetical protein
MAVTIISDVTIPVRLSGQYWKSGGRIGYFRIQPWGSHRPVGTYTVGAISVYEGVPCTGTEAQFAQQFINTNLIIGSSYWPLPSNWYTLELDGAWGQIGWVNTYSHDTLYYYAATDVHELRVADVAVFKVAGVTGYRYAVIHSIRETAGTLVVQYAHAGAFAEVDLTTHRLVGYFVAGSEHRPGPYHVEAVVAWFCAVDGLRFYGPVSSTDRTMKDRGIVAHYPLDLTVRKNTTLDADGHPVHRWYTGSTLTAEVTCTYLGNLGTNLRGAYPDGMEQWSLLNMPDPGDPVTGESMRTGTVTVRTRKGLARRRWASWYAYWQALAEPHTSLQWNAYHPSGDVWVLCYPTRLPVVDDDGYVYQTGDGYQWWQLQGLQVKTGGRNLHAVLDAAGRTHLAYIDAGSNLYHQTADDPRVAATYSTPISIADTADCTNPALVVYGDGSLGCWYMAGDTQAAKYSRDGGRTWAAYGGTMLGSNLRNVYPVCSNVRTGLTYAVGVRDGNLHFVWSNDQGVSQEAMPGGASEQTIGVTGDYAVPCLVCYPDGKVVAWSQSDTDEVVAYSSERAGFAGWAAIT